LEDPLKAHEYLDAGKALTPGNYTVGVTVTIGDTMLPLPEVPIKVTDRRFGRGRPRTP
jgi:hypothetical protein